MISWPNMVGDEILSEHQQVALDALASHRISILGGRPGVGKSITAARLVRKTIEQHGQNSICVAGPTGKSAVRITDAMQRNGVDVIARTIHSLLGIRGGDSLPEFGRENPLPFMFLVIDEASMIDVPLMRMLLEARDEGASVLLCGDVGQLSPVGHGAPLRDMIFAGVPSFTLTEIRRNCGRIVRSCNEIIDQSRFSSSPKLNIDDGENLLLIERSSPEDQIDTLAAVIEKYQRDHESGDATIDPIWDIQVVVAVNDKSEIGRRPLNRKLQVILNRDGTRVDGNPFRVGDKIINTKNDQYKSLATQDDKNRAWHAKDSSGLPAEDSTYYVANGEQAEVLAVDATKIIARLMFPDRIIQIPRSPQPQPEESSEEPLGSGCFWELGYAISGHKSQGSEWPIVIVMLDDSGSAKHVQSKQWIYTAVSRAKKLCIVIGQQRTANACCTRDALRKRKTLLAEKIVALRSRVEMTHAVCELLLEGMGA